MKNPRQLLAIIELFAAVIMTAATVIAQKPQLNEGYLSGRLAIHFSSDTLKAPSVECHDAEMLLAVTSSTLPLPKGSWTFAVVCDEATWQHLIQANAEKLLRMGRDPSKGEIYGGTILDRRLTILRGTKLVHPDGNITAAHIIAHELAHIYTGRADEIRVESLALQWLEKSGNPVTLLAEFDESKN